MRKSCDRPIFIFILVVVSLCSGLLAQGGQDQDQRGKPASGALPPDLVERATALRERALEGSKAFDFLCGLTSEVGPRFAGSAGDRRAVEWARKKLESLGFSNVRAEDVIVPCWVRGKAEGKITAPLRKQVDVVALGGSVGTPPGGIEGEVVMVADLEELSKLDRSDVSGRIVFFNKRMRRTREGTGYGEVVPVRRHGAARAAPLGAKAVIIRPVATSRTPQGHTGTTHYEDGIEKIPIASLSNPHADLIEDQLEKGKKVRFSLELGCRCLPDRKSANVIGEIPGREMSREVVLLAAHLDSWDLGAGALDDGAGCAIVTEAARLIGELDPAPRRTIRVLLAANEEFGVSGGLAYEDRYGCDAGLHVMAMEADFGAGRVWGMRSRVALKDLVIVKDLLTLLAPLGIGYSGNNTLGGTDILPLLRHRVPLIEMRHDATDYFDFYHSVNDTLDKVDPRDLAQSVAAYAVAALVAAEVEGGFARAPKFRGKLPAPFDSIASGKEMPR